MSAPVRHWGEPAFYYWGLVSTAALCLVGAVLLGLFLGLASAFPLTWVDPMSVRLLRPLHTLLALSALWGGIAGGIGLCAAPAGRGRLALAMVQHALLLAFLLGAGISLGAERFSGREYFGWPDALSGLLVPGLALSFVLVLRHWSHFRDRSPEAAWFLLLGTLLLPLGLIEAQGYHLGSVGLDLGRDLTLQWHALDTVIAGWMICLYGLGVLATPGPGRPLRVPGLFLLAAIGILFDFGHHNYPSPQPHALKLVAFCATMLAAVSFYRHSRAARRLVRLPDPATAAFRHVEYWTLFAVGSGLLMAVPPINAYTHGTYVVVGHTMGSMIGVNVLLLAAVVYRLRGARGRLRILVIRSLTVSNALLVLAFTGLGLARGILRPDHEFFTWIARVRPYYVLIPLAALPLTVALLALGADLFRLSFGQAEPARVPVEE